MSTNALLHIKSYMQSARRATLAQLESQFSLEPELLEQMLEFLCRKGMLRRADAQKQCASCLKCPKAQVRCYEWQEKVA